MDPFVLWGVGALATGVGILASAFMWRSRAKRGFKEDDVLQTLGATLVVLGIVFGDDRLVGYSFMGAGVLLSIISLVIRRRPRRE